MIKKFNTYITPFQEERLVHLYLPDDYDHTNERYPAIYMYDGHNLYFDEDATYGKSWGLKTFLDAYDKKFIIVGIECNHVGNKRLEEYCPYDVNAFGKHLKGEGQIFMDWLVNEFKPWIDANYRTIPFRECTAIGGSSMGGLMAYYTVMKYNLYFSKAACLSPAIGICSGALKKDFMQTKINPDTRVYFSYGKLEVKNVEQTLQRLAWIQHHLDINQAKYQIFMAEGGHNESCWESQNQRYMDFLWK